MFWYLTWKHIENIKRLTTYKINNQLYKRHDNFFLCDLLKPYIYRWEIDWLLSQRYMSIRHKINLVPKRAMVSPKPITTNQLSQD